MLKRITSLTVVAAMLLLTLAGCGPTNPSSSSSSSSQQSSASASSSADNSSSAASDASSSSSASSESSDPNPLNKPVVLYLPNENVDGFKTKAAMTDGTAEHIVSLLISENALPDGCAVLAFTVNATEKSCKVDMNAVYGQAVTNTGTTGEYMLFGCLVNTLLTFFEVDEISITVEGKTITTGHNVYDYPLGFYPSYN